MLSFSKIFYLGTSLIIFYASSLIAKEPIELTKEQFILKNPSPERRDIIDSIVKQFDYKLKSGVSQKELDELWNNIDTRNELKILRFQIINQKLYADGYDITNSFFSFYVNYFQKLLSTYKLKDVDFILHCLEGLPKSTHLNLPSFMVTKDISYGVEKNIFLLPDDLMMNDKWSELTNKILKANIDYSWEDKINKVFWRGSTTGGGFKFYNLNNFDKLPRLKIIMLSLLYPDLINASFSRHPRFYLDDNLKTILTILSPKNLQRVKE